MKNINKLNEYGHLIIKIKCPYCNTYCNVISTSLSTYVCPYCLTNLKEHILYFLYKSNIKSKNLRKLISLELAVDYEHYLYVKELLQIKSGY